MKNAVYKQETSLQTTETFKCDKNLELMCFGISESKSYDTNFSSVSGKNLPRLSINLGKL